MLSCRTDEPPHEHRHGVEFVRVPAWNILERYAVPYPLFGPSLLPTASRLVLWSDIVHGHGFLYQSTLVALWFARLFRRPTVLTEYAGFVYYRQRAWNAIQAVAHHTLGRLALAMADTVVVSGQRAAMLVRRLAGSDKQVHLLPVSVDTEKFHPVTAEEKARLRRTLGWDQRPKILFVGRLVPRKGIELLLQAAHPEYDIVLCGRGNMSVPEQNGVYLYRSPDDETLLKIYQAADVYVLPSHSEGAFPLAAQEAMACGLPVVAIRDPIYGAYVNEEVVQFVPARSDALQQALLRLATSPRARHTKGELAATWARTHFSLEAYTARHLAIYRHLLEEKQNG